MNASFRCAALAIALTAFALPGAARAQYTAVPFIPTPNQDPQVSATLIGVTLRGDFGFPADAFDSYTPFSALLILNYGRLSASAGIGTLVDGDLPNRLTLGGSLGYDFTFQKAALPTLTVQAAAGRSSLPAEPDALSWWDFPIGLGATLSFGPPNLDLSFEPWLALRGQLRSVETSATTSESDLGFGISGGLRIFTVKEDQTHNLGLHGAVDWLWIEPPGGDGVKSEFTASIGLFFRWNTIKA